MDDKGIGLHGASARQDLIDQFGRQEVRRRLASGAWRALWRGVIVEAARSADLLTLASAAVLFAGPRAVLAGPTAAHLHGCRSVEPLPVHVLVPYGARLYSKPGLVVHNGRDLDADRRFCQDLPVLCLERVVAHALCRGEPAGALALADEALAMVGPGQRETYRSVVAERLDGLPDPRGKRRGTLILATATGRAASPAESWFLWRIVDSGFPPPQVNLPLLDRDGQEIFRLDYAWEALRIAVEYNGYAYHVGREQEDAARAEALRRRGWIVIFATADDLADPGRFEAELEKAFRCRGVDMSGRKGRLLRGRKHRDKQARG